MHYFECNIVIPRALLIHKEENIPFWKPILFFWKFNFTLQPWDWNWFSWSRNV